METSRIPHFLNRNWATDLDKLKKFPKSPFKAILMTYDKRLDILRVIRNRLKIQANCDLESVDYGDVYVAKIIEDESNSTIKTESFLIVFKNNNILVYFTNKPNDNIKEEVSLLNNLYPLASRVYLRSYSLLKLLNDLELTQKFTILTKSYVQKKYFIRPETKVCFHEEDYKKTFDNALRERVWIDSIFVEIFYKEDLVGKVRISRKGKISFSRMLFSDIFRYLLIQIIEDFAIVENKINQLKARNSEFTGTTPLVFKMSEPVFVNDEFTDNFIETVRTGLVRWGFSIINRDGPFIHILLHDYAAGSNYDILINSDDKIVIIPQTQLTHSSIIRLIGFLKQNYDGEIENER